MAKQKKQLSKAQVNQMMPSVKKFNSIADAFLNLLGTKVKRKKQRLSRIAVLVKDMPLPHDHTHNISIQTIDMRNTKVKVKGRIAYSQTMNWEDDFKHRNRGFVL